MSQTDYKNVGNDPKTREMWTDVKARDTATDPMVGEKATDPKMQDTSTDAWKRDGIMQTSQQKHVKNLLEPKQFRTSHKKVRSSQNRN